MAGELALGPVVFRGFEIPERLRFGGRQALAVHDLPGGGRVVDVMGDQDAPITWSGVFSGPDAMTRVRLLERLRRSGEVLSLSWQAWRYSVVLERFEVAGSNPAWIPYRIKACAVSSAAVITRAELPFVFSLDDAAALGAGPGLEAQIGVAEGQLGSGNVAASILAAGQLARLVTARAFIEAQGNIS